MTKKRVLVSIPHASIKVPPLLKPHLSVDMFDIKNHADLYTDEIYRVPNALIVESCTARLLVDVNRAPDDIDMERVFSADSVIVQTTPDGKPVYLNSKWLNDDILHELLEEFYKPFHDELEKTIKENDVSFLLDGHSMWSKGPSALADAGNVRPEIALGNRDYTTCSRAQTLFIKDYFEDLGYEVHINSPYKGKFTLGYHCHRKSLPGIQIEFNRKLFLDEKTLKRNPVAIEKLNKQIERLVDLIESSLI